MQAIREKISDIRGLRKVKSDPIQEQQVYNGSSILSESKMWTKKSKPKPVQK